MFNSAESSAAVILIKFIIMNRSDFHRDTEMKNKLLYE